MPFVPDKPTSGFVPDTQTSSFVPDKPKKKKRGMFGFLGSKAQKALRGFATGGVFGAAGALLQDTPEIKKAAGGIAKMAAQSTARTVAKPLVSLRAGITGDFSPQDLPIAGEVTPYEIPESAASTYIAKGKDITPEESQVAKDIASRELKGAATDIVGTYLETGLPGSKPLLKAGSKILGKAFKPAQTYLRQGAGKISESMWSKVLKPLQKATNQNVVGKAQELGYVGSRKSMMSQAQKGMDEALVGMDNVINSQQGGTLINIEKQVLPHLEKGKALMGESLTGSSAKYVQRLDELGAKLLEMADDGGNISVKALNQIRKDTDKALAKLFGKRWDLMTPGAKAEYDTVNSLRNAIGETSPELAAANQTFHKNKLVHDSLERAADIRKRNNVFGLLSHLGFYGGAVALGGMKGAFLGIANELLSTAAARSAFAKGASGVEKWLLKDFDMPLENAKFLAPFLYNAVQQGSREEGLPEEETQ